MTSSPLPWTLGLFLLLGLHLTAAFPTRGRRHVAILPQTLTDYYMPPPPDLWFTQMLDHVNRTNTNTWLQKYQVRTDLWRPGGPVFLNVGAECVANSSWLVGGGWIDWATNHGAMLFQLEHRFYGDSRPTPDLSLGSLRYLSSEQAIEDVAYFIRAMKLQYNMTDDTKWIALGCSYAGSLAAWARLKYPHLVHGAVCASGPVLAKVDYFEFYNAIRESLRTYNDQCPRSIWNAQWNIKKLLSMPRGQQHINKVYNLCDPIDVTKQNDVFNLYETLGSYLAIAVQYNDPPGPDIQDICQMMGQTELGTPVERLGAVMNYLVGEGECMNYNYDFMVDYCRNTSYDPMGDGIRQWSYQQCTEFGLFQSSEYKDSFFGRNIPLHFLVNQCADIFGPEFSPDEVTAGVYRTNTLYGGMNLQATRVVHVHGSVDPWHTAGIINSTLPSSPSILINGVAHCAVLRTPQPTDNVDLQHARQRINHLIGMWIQEKDPHSTV